MAKRREGDADAREGDGNRVQANRQDSGRVAEAQGLVVKGPEGAVNLDSATAFSSGRMELIPARGIGESAGPNKRTTPTGETIRGDDAGLGTVHSVWGAHQFICITYSTLRNVMACVQRRVGITSPLACAFQLGRVPGSRLKLGRGWALAISVAGGGNTEQSSVSRLAGAAKGKAGRRPG